jgi:hypothetical protein
MGGDGVVRSMKRSLRCRCSACLRGGMRECRASRNRGEGQGRGEEPGGAAVRDSPAYSRRIPGVWGAERAESGGGNWGGPSRPGNLRKWLLPECRAL